MGAGAVGSVFGGMLCRAGHEVSLIGRRHYMEAIRRKGLSISGIFGEHHIRGLRPYSSPGEVADGPFPVVLLTTKSFDTEAALTQVLPLLDAESLVISLQNGLGNIEAVSGLIGKGRTIGGRVMFGVEFVAPGHFHVSVFAEKVMLGSADGGLSQDRVAGIADIFTGAGIPTEATEEIQRYLWGKVLFNCCLNALSALLDTCYGKLGEQAETRQIISDVIDEVFSLAGRKGVNMGFVSPDAYREFFFNCLLVNAYSHHSSMLQDVKRGKRTEIDAINGAIVALAEKEGIDTPVNRLLTRLVRAQEKLAASGDK